MAQSELNEDECGLIKVFIPLKLAEHLTSGQIKVDNFCRICFQDSSDMISIFEKDVEHHLAEMFTLFTSIQVKPNDGLPPYICLKCKQQIINCYEFKHQCEKSDIIWKATITGELICKIENNDKDDDRYKEAESNLADVVKLELDSIKEERLDDNFSDLIAEMSHLEDTNERIEDVNIRPMEYTCSFCSKKFLDLDSYKRHEKTHLVKQNSYKNQSGKHSCLYCNQSFNLENDLHIHSSIHTGNGTKCNLCGKEFKTKAKLKRHLLRHMSEKKHKCLICNKAFSETTALHKHRRVHTGEVFIKKFNCDICDKKFASNYSLNIHTRTHSGLRPYKCTFCTNSFTTQRLLNSHMRVHTDHKPYKCRYCEKSYRHRNVRDTHHRTHTGERPYVCSVCGKTFIQSSNFKTHMRIHTGEKSYKCNECDRRFTAITTLKMHVLTHTREKPFGCSICGKRFARKNMSSHMRIHTGERNHVCSVCHKRFSTSSNLRDHSRLHTGEKPYECNTCLQKFASKSYLRVHMQSHEQKKPPRRRPQKKKHIKNIDSGNKQVNVVKQEVAIDIVTDMNCIDELNMSTSNYVIIEEDTVEMGTYSHDDIKILPLA